MRAKPIETLDVRNRREWRKWLKENHNSISEIWLVFHKLHTGVPVSRRDGAILSCRRADVGVCPYRQPAGFVRL